jgi:hypothetical protein
MARAKGTHRILLEVPTDWLPELAAAAEEEQRSRHKVMLRFVRQGLDARIIEKRMASAVKNGAAIRVQPVPSPRTDVTPRFKMGGK